MVFRRTKLFGFSRPLETSECSRFIVLWILLLDPRVNGENSFGYANYMWDTSSILGRLAKHSLLTLFIWLTACYVFFPILAVHMGATRTKLFATCFSSAMLQKLYVLLLLKSVKWESFSFNEVLSYMDGAWGCLIVRAEDAAYFFWFATIILDQIWKIKNCLSLWKDWKLVVHVLFNKFGEFKKALFGDLLHEMNIL